MSLGPAPVLALLIGVLHVSIYVLIRGSAGQRLPWLVLASFLGAWAGDALAMRLNIGLLLVGDFHVVAASAFAWVGILGVAIVAILGPQAGRESGGVASGVSADLVVRRRDRSVADREDFVRNAPSDDTSDGDGAGEVME